LKTGHFEKQTRYLDSPGRFGVVSLG